MARARPALDRLCRQLRPFAENRIDAILAAVPPDEIAASAEALRKSAHIDDLTAEEAAAMDRLKEQGLLRWVPVTLAALTPAEVEYWNRKGEDTS